MMTVEIFLMREDVMWELALKKIMEDVCITVLLWLVEDTSVSVPEDSKSLTTTQRNALTSMSVTPSDTTVLKSVLMMKEVITVLVILDLSMLTIDASLWVTLHLSSSLMGLRFDPLSQTSNISLL